MPTPLLPGPRWDLGAFFPSLDAPELAAAHEQVGADLTRLRTLFEHHDVRGGAPRPPDDADLAAFEEVTEALNRLLAQVRLVGAFLYGHIATDARDDDAAGRHARFQTDTSSLGALTKRYEAWVARLGPAALVEGSPVAADHAFPLHRAARAAEHQMSEAEEGLAAELRLSGSAAWARLHRDITSRLSATVTQPDGTAEMLPISVVRGLATDPDGERRRAAYEAELAAWESVAVPLAAALNGAKGEACVLDRRRGWNDPLDAALFANNVERSSLEAMNEAVIASLPAFRRYLRAKSALLSGDRLPDGADPGGTASGGLAWWDLTGPLPRGDGAGGPLSWPDALGRVSRAFASYAPDLAGLVERAADQGWIDAEPRAGKVGGAFCMPVRGDESRVLLNYDGSLDSLQTLAHELGHAYHNTHLGPRTPLQRQTPMALAETASIFCETIMVEAGLQAAGDDGERLALLDTDLQGSTQVVVDIHSRFLFETELYRRRAETTLGVDELCDLMLESQEQAYGDGLHPDHRHPWMWAVKSHYFTPFYNWPYTFGLLFGLGLYARFRDDPERFRAGYGDLLATTGLGPAAELADRFGIDIDDPSFWASSLAIVTARIDRFESIGGATAVGGGAWPPSDHPGS